MKGNGLETSNANIWQVNGNIFEKYGFLDYLKSRYPLIKDKYLMIEIVAINVSNTLLDSVFINMIQLASMAGYNYIMIML